MSKQSSALSRGARLFEIQAHEFERKATLLSELIEDFVDYVSKLPVKTGASVPGTDFTLAVRKEKGNWGVFVQECKDGSPGTITRGELKRVVSVQAAASANVLLQRPLHLDVVNDWLDVRKVSVQRKAEACKLFPSLLDALRKAQEDLLNDMDEGIEILKGLPTRNAEIKEAK